MAQQGPIVNGVDTDAFFGTIEQLKEYGYHAPVAPVEPPVAPVEAPAPVPTPEPVVVPPVIPDPVLPAPETVIVPTVEPPVLEKPPVKVIVPDPTYYSLWDLVLAFLKKLFIKK